MASKRAKRRAMVRPRVPKSGAVTGTKSSDACHLWELILATLVQGDSLAVEICSGFQRGTDA